MKKILVLLLAAAVSSCSKTIKKPEHIQRSFYYWKNNEWQFKDSELSACKSLNAKKVYVKFFEVERNEFMGAFPTAKSGLNFYRNDSLAIVPTVYLRNEVFLNASRGSLDTLADNVNFLITKYARESIDVKEFQMDCDWTPKSRANYFYFLKKLKAVSGKEISCTLRLYPYKYPDKMGVPPVDRVSLMCYNLVNPLRSHEKNSILDLDELKSYVKGVREYPLPLDIALPIYSWMQVYQNNRFETVVYSNCSLLKEKAMKPDRGKPLWYTVVKDTAIDNIYLRIGDKIKYEEITPDKIEKAVAIITENVPLRDSITVTLFHLDENQLSNYTHEDLSRIFTGFTR